ncbi:MULTISPECIES: dual specificity protein phosphatase family protein [unclassified Rhizobium]|uniref:dual specificity protein phosphatase family protein n=1 Tax=unclassified Rhizobium TaxID=2613769 RepID=UPI0016213DE9|nr:MULTISPECIES: dual specificity protein phosphatase family protein [unclassified Rhizobium]MBB3386632.1 protein tyrosine/serine phosphatase [Rhizobium sp. BK098]MBB3618336.1 protein tyrosine/serine phosphatase [Rhizobium sp. BK609]MBB3683993.1 protein tyrosine/serine phosphatase [Rhizobium sp. BK612]
MTVFRKVVLAAFGTIGILGGSCAAYAGFLHVTGNFHSVIDDQFYRSAQPTSDELASYIQAHGIKTVINLRGAHPGTVWYDDEVSTVRGLGITHIDFGMSATKAISPERAQRLVELMASAQKPILIHCLSGSDRSGLAAALYVRKIAGLDEARAEGQLSFYYGHVGIPLVSAAYAMDRSWRDFEARYNNQVPGELASGATLR